MGNCDMTAPDLSYQLTEAEGHAEDMAVEGEVSLKPLVS